MSILRALLLLCIFFGGLYILRDPISNSAPNLDTLLVKPFKEFFTTIKSATTTLGDYNSLPGGVSATADIEPKGVPYANATTTVGLKSGPGPIMPTATTSKATPLPPIKASVDTTTSLSEKGIITYTNSERRKAGLSELKENAKLAASAQLKLEDMFKYQYFEHVSPSGVSVTDLVEKEGYAFIVIGENLALGNFGGDSNVVAAWMASPGHKANILNTKYKEIGVAVGQHAYQGKVQWIAVQHFGTLLSTCPSPSTTEKQVIDGLEKNLLTQETAIQAMKKDIDQSTGEEYKNKIDEYNKLVEVYNTALTSLKAKIAQYNDSVKKFNSCVAL